MSTGTTELLGAEGGAVEETGLVDGKEVTARSPLQLFWRRLRRDKVAMVALGIVVLAILVAIFAPLIVKVAGAPDPERPERRPARRLRLADRPERRELARRRPARPRRVRARRLRRAHLARGRVHRHGAHRGRRRHHRA